MFDQGHLRIAALGGFTEPLTVEGKLKIGSAVEISALNVLACSVAQIGPPRGASAAVKLPSLPPPVSFAPCCVHVVPERVYTHAAPTPPLSR